MPSGIYKRIYPAWNKGTKGIVKPNSGSFKPGLIPRKGYLNGIYIKKFPNGYKASEETKEKLRQKRLGKKLSIETKIKIGNSNKGKKRSKDAIKRYSDAKIERRNRLGYVNSPETRIKISKAGYGRFVSIETRRKMSESARGSNSRFWEGGITRLNLAIRRTYKYRQWRSDVFLRDSYTCQNCFVRGCYLEADHIKAFCLILKENNIHSVEGALKCEELWDINNGRTLCKACHKKTENHAGRAKLLLKTNLI
jgi:hypothetical protein